MWLALAVGLSSCLVVVCAQPVAAQTATTGRPEGTSKVAPAMPYAVGVMGGASPRGAQVGARVNVGMGWLVSLDAEVDYWGWIRFDDQNHLTVGRLQLRIGPRHRRGWRVAGLVGGMTAFNTDGYTGMAGVGFEREYGRLRVCIDAGVGMFTVFVNAGVLFGPNPRRRQGKWGG